MNKAIRWPAFIAVFTLTVILSVCGYLWSGSATTFDERFAMLLGTLYGWFFRSCFIYARPTAEEQQETTGVALVFREWAEGLTGFGVAALIVSLLLWLSASASPWWIGVVFLGLGFVLFMVAAGFEMWPKHLPPKSRSETMIAHLDPQAQREPDLNQIPEPK